jgi:hypothetical protein
MPYRRGICLSPAYRAIQSGMTAQRNPRFRQLTTRRVQRPHVENRLVFVDIELAVVGRRRAILQIAAVAASQSLLELDCFEAKIRLDESRFRPSQISNRHFNVSLWRNEGRSPKAVACDFAKFLSRHASASVAGADGRQLIVAQLVAHNAEFDGVFLRKWFEDLGLFFPASYRIFCTLHRAMWYFQEDRSKLPPCDFKLGTLCRYFGVPFSPFEAHDALADVRATMELYRRMTMHHAALMTQSLN